MHEELREREESKEFWHSKKVLVTGGSGFIGTHLAKRLESFSPEQITIPRSASCDLTKRTIAEEIVDGHDIVIHLAAKVGGIGYNEVNGTQMLIDNTRMLLNVLGACARTGVQKIVTVSTACIYPENTPIPFREENIWDGYPSEIHAPYALALKNIIPLTEPYARIGLRVINLIPTNVYGPGDKFDQQASHVIPALIRKFLEAKQAGNSVVEVWGTGNATREFLFVQDAVEGIILASQRYNSPLPVNLGTGKETTIQELAERIKNLTGFQGDIFWNTKRPEGQPRRTMDVSKATREFGFRATTPFDQGLRETFDWYLSQFETL